MRPIIRFSALVLVAGLLACGAGTDDPLDRVDGTANQERVADLLHEQGLFAVPEIKEVSDRYVEQYQSGASTREEAAREFRIWLERWIAENPERAAELAAGAEADSD